LISGFWSVATKTTVMLAVVATYSVNLEHNTWNMTLATRGIFTLKMGTITIVNQLFRGTLDSVRSVLQLPTTNSRSGGHVFSDAKGLGEFHKTSGTHF
jgi:hypothetical protein